MVLSENKNRVFFRFMNKIVIIIIFAISLIFRFSGGLFSNFIIEEEPQKEQVVIVDKKNDDLLHQDVAYNIKAFRIDGSKESIKIIWDINLKSADEYVVGRSESVIDTPEKALSAISVYISSPKTASSFIDTGLKPGKYYYVVLSKERIAQRDIILIKDVNYTSNPVVIEFQKEKNLNRYISKIFARKISDNGIVVSWKKTPFDGISYTLYRSSSIIDSKDKLKIADKVTSIQDNEQFIDDTIYLPGTYYYAVTAKDKTGAEDVELNNAQNYTTQGVDIEGYSYEPIARNIRAKFIEGDVIVQWAAPVLKQGEYAVSYEIYRSRYVINNRNAASKAVKIGTVEGGVTAFTDKNPKKGSYFYAVVAKLSSGAAEMIFKNGFNYISDPVDVEEFRKKVIEKQTPLIENVKPRIGDSGEVDDIIKRTFYAGRYVTAVRELEYIIRNSGNRLDVARAKLFAGRSYVELGNYSRALDYFIMKDVSRYYPEESQFWRDYALMRMK